MLFRSQFPPISAFVLQSRAEQGEWSDLDEAIDANQSEVIVPGLRKVTQPITAFRQTSHRAFLLSRCY